MDHVQDVLPNGRTLRLWSRADDWVSNQVFWRGWRAYEPETADFFFRHSQKASVVVDVGAYVGFFSVLAGHANPDATILALEPHPKIFERLQNHLHLNGLHNARAFRFAAGAEGGRATFFTDPNRLPTSSGLSADFFRGTSHVPIEVEVVSLDDLLDRERVGRVDLMKIDTESTEPDVLAGMRRRLASDRPLIVCEVLPDRGAEVRLRAELERLTYVSFLLTPDGLRAETTLTGHATLFNHLFVPVERSGEF